MANGYDRQEAARSALNAESAEKGAMHIGFRGPEGEEEEWEDSSEVDKQRTLEIGKEHAERMGVPSAFEADYVPQPGITPGPDLERQYFRRNMPFADVGLTNMSTEQLMEGRGRLSLTMAAAGSGTDPIDATQQKANSALLERIDQELSLRGQAF